MLKPAILALIRQILTVAGTALVAKGYVQASDIEPVIGALLTIGLAAVFAPMMPVMLSFAAGAMLYVVVEELVPEMAQGTHTNVGTVLFAGL